MTTAIIRSKIVILSFFLCAVSVTAQNKYEREYRIKKSQFPEKALKHIADKLEDSRRIRFYKEIDSNQISYEAKFKKDRLKYSIEFNENGKLEDIEIEIKPVDIPNDVFIKINADLTQRFSKYRLQKIQQQYPLENNDAETTIKNAFQNLILPSIKYELMVIVKNTQNYEEFEMLYNATGTFEKIRKSLPPNYDHVLY